MAQLVKILLEAGVLKYRIIIVATVLNLAPLQFLAIYPGCVKG